MIESGGEYGKSALRRFGFPSTTPDLEYFLDSSYFAEGLTVLKGKIYQLTWLERKIFVYSLDFILEDTVKLPSEVREGWGICNDGVFLYISDGSSYIHKISPKDYKVLSSTRVFSESKFISSLNELEWVDGEIWANIYYSKYIARISPETGKVLSWIDLSGIEKNEKKSWLAGYVLNGIAVNKEKIIVTGKCWEYMYEIELIFDHNTLEVPKLK